MHACPQSTAPARPSAFFSPPSRSDPSHSMRWSLLGAAVVVGLGSGFVLNRMAPVEGQRAALARYAVALAPAALYLGGYLVRDLAHRTLEVVRGPARFRINNPAERARQERLGIQGHPHMASTYLLAWLNHPQSVAFSDEEIRAAAGITLGRDIMVGLVTGARQAHWSTRPLPGSLLNSTWAPEFRTPESDPEIAFHLVEKHVYGPGEFTLSLDQLAVSDVLVAVFDGTFACNQKDRVVMGIERQSEDRFQLLDSGLGHEIIERASDFEYIMYVTTLVPYETHIRMIRLQKDPDPETEKTVRPFGWLRSRSESV